MVKSQIDTIELRRRVEVKIDQCLKQAERYFNMRLTKPIFNFKQRGRSAGTAYLQTNEMRFNAFMLNQDPEKFIDEVVPHEVAHLVVYQVYGSKPKPHGPEWVAIMEHLFNVDAERTHTFEVPKPKRLYLYQCGCQTHEFTAHRHGRVKRGTQYLCKLCKEPLVFLHAN
ncbi:SprT family zinc-dependent metalloprotease [Marinomonas piezotolerans]|uniref:SprT family zinc-dependent metalloprotease n=1 Tax=Marinomonas piezotolerans TaxID=2213058 RepID=A0A370UDG2_9GAMM|nr:SprT family zinc-dependent metalloprotease [Marinomonas piezotolerans]RDL45824.1 SprT family zinc-dependent metalloprotease [Marinomonas piezotolerans]